MESARLEMKGASSAADERKVAFQFCGKLLLPIYITDFLNRDFRIKLSSLELETVCGAR